MVLAIRFYTEFAKQHLVRPEHGRGRGRGRGRGQDRSRGRRVDEAEADADGDDDDDDEQDEGGGQSEIVVVLPHTEDVAEDGLPVRFPNYRRGRFPPQPRLPLSLRVSGAGPAGLIEPTVAEARRRGKRPATAAPAEESDGRSHRRSRRKVTAAVYQHEGESEDE